MNKFYRCRAKVGHQGTGHSGEMSVFVYGESEDIVEVCRVARKFPMVKHTKVDAISRVDDIEEQEYILGLIYNPYYKYMREKYNVPHTNSIERIAGYTELFRKHKFTTPNGKALKYFYDKYTSMKDDRLRKIVENEFQDWAERTLERDAQDYPWYISK